MRFPLPLLLVLSAATFSAAQTLPSQEFAPLANVNPTGNGPSVANQIITFQNNTDNPSGNTFTSTSNTATFALSNQVYSQSTAYLSTGTGVAFGAASPSTTNTTLAAGVPLFPAIDAYGGTTASVANYYTSPSEGSAGTGISITANSAVELFTSVEPLPATVPANARYQMADLLITFNRQLVNPTLHLTGLGGAFSTTVNGTTTTAGFATELDFISAGVGVTGVSLSKLSGSPELTVTAARIANNAANPSGTAGNGAATGSVLVTTPAAGVRSLLFRLYLRPLTAGGTIHGTTEHAGDAWLISVSERTASVLPLPVVLTGFSAQTGPQHQAVLSWTTASELNSAYFEVERSLDGAHFRKVGQVVAQGSKATGTDYSFRDVGFGLPAAAPVYYRLRQVDRDGVAAYSPVRAVSFGVAPALGLYPTLVQAGTTLDLSGLPATSSYRVLLLDALGRPALMATLEGGQSHALNLAHLAAGPYTAIVTGTQPDGTPLRQSFRLHKE